MLDYVTSVMGEGMSSSIGGLVLSVVAGSRSKHRKMSSNAPLMARQPPLG